MPVLGEFSQTVTVDGFPAFVHDLSIQESSSERVLSIDFAIEDYDIPGQSNAYSRTRIGNIIEVTQVVDGSSQSWQAIIVDVQEKRASTYTFKRALCRSLEYIAAGTRFLDSWVKTPASTIIIEAWQRHGQQNPDLAGISLSGVDLNSTIIQEYTSEFDSLYNLMDQICLLTQWAWNIRFGVLYFFDPLLRTGPDIDQASLQIEGSSLELKQSLQGVYNVYRIQAWAYKTVSIGKTFRPGDCIDGFNFDRAILANSELIETPVIKQQKWIDAGLEVTEVSSDGIVRLNESLHATPSLSGSLSMDLKLRSLVWVERIDEASIIRYGRRDAPPISEDGGMSINAATQYLDNMLEYKATPAVDLSLSILGVGWSPDMVVDVFLDDPELAAALYVTDVTRTTNGNDLQVQITLTSPSEIVPGETVEVGTRRSRSAVDPAYEIGRRLERLERKASHPAQKLGVNSDLFGIFKGTETVDQTTGWAFGVSVNEFQLVSDTTGWSETITVGSPFYGISVGDDIGL